MSKVTQKMGTLCRILGAFLFSNSPLRALNNPRCISRYTISSHVNNKYAKYGRTLWGGRAVLSTSLVSVNSLLKSGGDTDTDRDLSTSSTHGTSINVANNVYVSIPAELHPNIDFSIDKSATVCSRYAKPNQIRDVSILTYRAPAFAHFYHNHDLKLMPGPGPGPAGAWNSHVVVTRNYSTRRSVFRTKQKASYYDILGITPHATQAQVKSAYYKLSKLHHPDRQQNQEPKSRQESQDKFSEINEAYGILGNPILRRRYDRGILSPRDTVESVKKQEAASARDRTVYRPTTESKIYDFDAFYYKHYGESIAREKRAREAQMEREAQYSRLMADAEKTKWYPRIILAMVMGFGSYYLYKDKIQDWKSAVKNKK